MDNETGELSGQIIIHKNTETGEDEYSTVCLNDETGEEERFGMKCYVKKPFRITRYATEKPRALERKHKQFKTSEKRTEFITAIVFLIPTMIIFTPLLGVIVLTFDIILHKWCHKQNSKLKSRRDETIYYQSPLHMIYKEFCSTCVAEQDCKKMNKIQDIRNNRLKRYMEESIRRVVT